MTAERSIVGAKVEGFCPYGCGRTLFLGSGGYVTCAYLECPCPDAVSTILEERETEHIVVITREGFSIQHPLRERVDGELFDCGLHVFMRELAGPPRAPGRYRARRYDLAGTPTWQFEPADAADSRKMPADSEGSAA